MVAKPSPDPMASMWAWMAHDVRLYRMRAGMTGEELGRVLKCVRSTVSRVESGQLQLDEKQADALDALWKTHGHFARMLRYARRANDPDWIKHHTEFEKQARVIKAYEALLVPGLLQTAEYARAAFLAGSLGNVDELLAARMQRQEILNRAEPPRLWVLLDQGVVERPVGGPGVMREQLHRLVEEGERRHISIRIVPRSCGMHVGLDGAFEILFHERGNVAYNEAQLGGRLVISDAEVLGMAVRYDQIGAQAWPEGPSREYIQQQMEAMP